MKLPLRPLGLNRSAGYTSGTLLRLHSPTLPKRWYTNPAQCIPRTTRHFKPSQALSQRPAYRTTTHSAAAASPQSPQSPTDSPSLSDQVRLLMRRVPYPVAIITSTDPHAPNNSENATESSIHTSFRGMTVSSFNTVTLTPEPTISFNVRRPSETLTALQSSKRFLVHLLAPNADTAALARDFSKGNQNLRMLKGEGDFEFVPHRNINESVDHQKPTSDDTESRPLPLLRKKTATASETAADKSVSHDDPSFSFILECALQPQSINVHDHTIVVGTVVRALSTHLTSPGLSAHPASAGELCLTYANTRFWEMGREI